MALKPIGQIIRLQAERDPDRPAITCDGRSVTCGELDKRTNRLARAFEGLGVRQDDFVTIALPNGIEFYEAAIATWKLGATPQPVSWRLPFLERDAIIQLASPTLVVGVDPGSHGDRPTVSPGFVADPSLSDDPLPDRTAKHLKVMTSGGSTGRPKLIVSNERGEADPEFAGFGLLADRAHLVPCPLYANAAFACSLAALARGNHLVVMRRFDPAEALALIERYQIDFVVLVPTMMHRIWRMPAEQREAFDLSSLRVVFHMSAPCPRWLKEAWIHWLGPERIFELYGGTEAQGATWINGKEWLEHAGSVGRPLPGSRMKVVDEKGQELPPSQIGAIYIRPDAGPGSTYHYIGAEPKSLDGWESLGDMGWVDEDGYLYLTDRKSDMILSGGANVYAAEVESALEAHEKVRSSAVIGLPDEDLGQRVHAIVQADGELSEEDLLEHMAQRLVRYKVPRSIEFVTTTLRDDAGKVRRRALRAERLPE